MKFVFFIILTFNYYVKAELIGVKEPTQIVGGAPAPKPGQFPYQVYLILHGEIRFRYIFTIFTKNINVYCLDFANLYWE